MTQIFKFSRYKEQYRANLKLALPVMLSQLGHVVVQLADNAMVGQYGGDDPLPLAAASFGGGLFFLSFVTIMGLTFGITPIVGELFVQGRKEECAKYLQNSLFLFGTIAVAVTFLQYALIPFMGYMGQPEAVVAMAIPYYKTLVWSLLPAIGYFVIKQFLEGVGNTKVAMYAVIVSNAINVFCNYLFIGGEMGAPELGTLGAGVATLIARIVLLVILLVYFLYGASFKPYREHFTKGYISRLHINKLVKMGLPISMQIMFEAGAFIVIGFLSGLFGATAISANQVGLTIGNCSFMIIVAIGSATTIRISHCYGARDIGQLKLAAIAGWHLALVWNISAAILFFAFSNQIPLLFSSNREVVELAASLMIFIVLYQIVDGVQCIAVGILRGIQDVKMIPYISFVSYWICTLPVACVSAFVLDIGVRGLYFGFFSGFGVAATLLIRRIYRRVRQLETEEQFETA